MQDLIYVWKDQEALKFADNIREGFKKINTINLGFWLKLGGTRNL